MTVFFVFYALSELPSNLLVRPIGVVPYLSFLIFAWGAVAMCLGFVQNFVQLTVLRLLLGLFEGGLNVNHPSILLLPDLTHILTCLPSLLVSI